MSPNSPNSPTSPRPKTATNRFPYKSLTFATGKLSISPTHALGESSHSRSELSFPCTSEGESSGQSPTSAGSPSSASSRLENFCAHPIKKTSSGVRKLLRRASQSFRHSAWNEQQKSLPIGAGEMKGGKGKGVVGDGESGVVLDERDTDDSYYAIDTTAPRKDFVDMLPSEITAHILSFLDHQSLVNCEQVSHAWREAALDRHVWREVFKNEHGPWKTEPGKDWKKMFTVRRELDRRWEKGIVSAKYLKGHTDSVYCVQFDDNKIITGSRDQTIRVWDIDTSECIKVIGHGFANQRTSSTSSAVEPYAPKPGTSDYHGASVLCLQFDDEILVSGSSDHTCIVWSIPSYTPIMRLRHHAAGVLDVCFDKKHIVSCSKDTTICIWDRQTGKLLRTLTGHRGPVNAVAIRGNLIVSASGDALIKLWNVDTGKCVRDFNGHHRGLACVQFSEDARTIVSGGNDQDIRVWDALTGECLRILQGHRLLVRTLHLDSKNKRIISGSYDQSVKVWELDTGKMVLDIQRFHSSWILSAKADFRRIVSTSQDNRTLMLDFSHDMKDLDVLG
ncbi:hypothetical protein RUND412_006304 [Rhizina undulata]